MAAVRFSTRAEVEQKLRPYRCRFVEKLPDGTEVWLTGWGAYFTLSPESPDGGEFRYDEWQLEAVVTNVVARTMPLGWDENLDTMLRLVKGGKSSEGGAA